MMKVFLRLFCLFLALGWAMTGQSFFDVAVDDPDRSIFEHLRDVKIIQQFQDGNFHPTALVTRAEALAYALRAGGIAIYDDFDAATLPADIDPNSWQAAVVARGRQLKVTNPNALTFSPDQPISKAEFLAFLFRATKVDFDSFFSESAFVTEDVPAESWMAPHFRYAHKYGVAHATINNQYLPFKALSRREVAVMIFRQLRLFHGDEVTKKFAELQTEIDTFIRFVRVNESEKATFHLQRIVQLSRAIALRKNDKNAVAINALSKSMQNLVISLRSLRYGNILRAAETLHLASNHAERAALKSAEIAPVAEQVTFIINETLDSMSRPRYAGIN